MEMTRENKADVQKNHVTLYNGRKVSPGKRGKIFYGIYACAFLTLFILVFIIGYIITNGIPHLAPRLFEWEYNTTNVSMLPAIINTVTMVLITLLISVPLGVFTAVYLVEYTKKNNPFIKVLRLSAQTLSGIPSICYGLFGYMFFVVYLKWSYSLRGGAVTMAIMVLPLIMRTTEEALLAVNPTYREASFALGAGKTHTIYKVVLPAAREGILSGIILSIGRIMGETAALIYTAGTVTGIAKSVMAPGRTLAVHMYALTSEGLHMEEAYATACVLLVLVFVMNLFSARILNKRR